MPSAWPVRKTKGGKASVFGLKKKTQTKNCTISKNRPNFKQNHAQCVCVLCHCELLCRGWVRSPERWGGIL